MNVGPKFANPKFHGAPTHLHAEMHTDQMQGAVRHEVAQTGIPGEMRDPAGQSPRDFLTQDYGEQRHLAYDSPLAQPAYSEHGKVGAGKF